MTVTAPARGGAGAPDVAPPPGAPDRATFGGRLRSGTALLREQFEGTPGRLRLAAALGVVAGLLLGLTAGLAFRESAHALQAADENAGQVTRLQQVSIDLVSADAAVTAAFLLGGEEPAAQRTAYTEGVAAAGAGIARAARVQPADADALAALNQAVLRYTGTVEQARANNRQGIPLGAGYLRTASSTLRQDALPVLDALVSANQERVDRELEAARWAAVWLVVGALLALAALVGVSVWLARRTHRYLSIPLVVASVIGLAVLVVGGLSLWSAGRTATDVRDGSYAAVLAASTARVDGFDAKANESLTLIARGSGAAFETAWKERATSVENNLASPALRDATTADARNSWDDYAAVHAEVRKLDDAGDWEEAVALATGTPPSGSAEVEPQEDNATTAFAAFDATSQDQLSEAAKDATTSLTDPVGGLRLLGWLSVLAGLVAALAAWWGVAARLEEYR